MKHYLIISPYIGYIGGTHGKGKSIREAMDNAQLNPANPRPYILFGCDHDDFYVNDMGGINWQGEAPYLIEDTINA